MSHHIKVRPLGVFGAEIQGIDLAHATSMEIDAIKQAWYRHDVLLFRNQQLTDDDLLSFSRHFGTLDSPPNQGAGRKSPPGYPE
ncbi:MAG TPA: TauD/TfdA family dioxygenase, partial [Steroidobacteraceae bacterium]|nr:TauD/TfdA family dioxygenase [Steroidobacteraceae bacterium]